MHNGRVATPIDYFYQIPLKTWNALTCYCLYLNANQAYSPEELKEIIKSDLNVVKTKKKGGDFSTFILELDKLVDKLEKGGAESEQEESGLESIVVASTWNSHGPVIQNFGSSSTTSKRTLSDMDDRQGKRRATERHHTSTAQPPTLASLASPPENLWSYWKDFLSSKKDDNTIFRHSPVRHGVIRIGRKLAHHIDTPLDLYNQTLVGIDSHSPANLEPYKNYIDSVVGSASLDDFKLNLKQNKDQDIISVFIKKTCKAIYYVYNPEVSPITHSEALFNYGLLHPLLIALSTSVPGTRFYPGEEKLESMVYCIRQQDPRTDNKSLYNADALIRSPQHNNLEVLLLETGFEYGNVNRTKYAMDNLKAMFGLLSMIKLVADTYRHASHSSFLNLKLYFVQAYNLKVYLWSLSLSPSSDFIMLLEDKVIVPFGFDNKATELLNFISFMISLQSKFSSSIQCLDTIKTEHEEAIQKYKYNMDDMPTSLDTIVNPSIIRISNLKKNQTGITAQAPGSNFS